MTHVLKVCVFARPFSSTMGHLCQNASMLATFVFWDRPKYKRPEMVTPGSWPLFADGNSGGA